MQQRVHRLVVMTLAVMEIRRPKSIQVNDEGLSS